jgi:hypothetical protein
MFNHGFRFEALIYTRSSPGCMHMLWHTRMCRCDKVLLLWAGQMCGQ